MALFQITKVRTVPGHATFGHRHEHIEQVELGSSEYRFSVQTVVKDLRDPNGDRYYTLGGGYRADVVVRSCPHCSERDYITTLPDSTTLNNLLELPRF